LANAKAWNDGALGKTLKRDSVYLTKRRKLHGRFNTIASETRPEAMTREYTMESPVLHE